VPIMQVQKKVQIKFKSSCNFFKISYWIQTLIQWPKHNRFRQNSNFKINYNKYIFKFQLQVQVVSFQKLVYYVYNKFLSTKNNNSSNCISDFSKCDPLIKLSFVLVNLNYKLLFFLLYFTFEFFFLFLYWFFKFFSPQTRVTTPLLWDLKQICL
jgi:hypothetical protein